MSPISCRRQFNTPDRFWLAASICDSGAEYSVARDPQAMHWISASHPPIHLHFQVFLVS